MNQKDKSKDELINELKELQQQYNLLKTSYQKDITDLRKAEIALIESEEKFRSLLDHSIQGISLIQEEKVTYSNPALQCITGLSLDETKALTIDQHFKLVHPDDRDKTTERQNRCKNGIPVEEENIIRIKHTDGTYRWVQSITKSITINNKPARLGMMINITKRKKAESELIKAKEKAEESEKQLKLISNNFVNGMIYQVAMLDGNKRKFTYLSDTVIKLYGCSANEAKENPDLIYSKIYEDDIADLIQKEKEALKEMSIFETEVRVNNPDGSIRWSYYVSKPRQINGLIYWDGLEIDITERKRAEEELIKSKEKIENSEKRFKALHNASFGGIAIHDKGLILDCNDGLSKISGYSNEELIGMDGMLLIDHDSREFVMKKIQANFESPYEAIGLRKNKETYPIRLEARSIPYKGRNVRVVEFRDISEQKSGEEELKKAKEKAEESDRLKSAFLANMSHEIRTPMNGILGFAELLKIPNLSGEEQSDYVNIIEKSGIRMLKIINDIIDLSKIESGQMEVSLSKVNLNEQIDYLYKFFKPETDEKGIELIYKSDITNQASQILTDKEKLYAILTNLIKNAVKYTSSGTIEFGCKKNNQLIEFFVKDSGSGISKEHIEIIFDRFRQGSEAFSKNFEGAGLGLSISKAFVTMLGGKIWVESKLGKGTTFFFTIPYKTYLD